MSVQWGTKKTPTHKNTKSERSSKKWCPECSFKRHGKNHDEGEHHKRGKK